MGALGVWVVSALAIVGCDSGQAPSGTLDARVVSVVGESCTDSAGCETGFCVDGMCCATACDTSGCMACASASTGQPDGTCAPAFDGVVCRDSAGACDVAETCQAGSCPADSFATGGSSCRAPVGPCDVGESCSGSSAACPTDAFVSTGTVCAPAAGACDVDDVCDGVSATCVPSFAPATTVCRATAGPCDLAEACTGVDAACPNDALALGTTCRASAGVCDPEETCDGSHPACPVDARSGAATVCRSLSGSCDVAESCDGVAVSCPADGFLADGASASCGAYLCGGAATCPSTCVATADCAGGFTCVDGTCQVAKVVFAAAGYTGNLGGLAGADAICQARAQAIALPGTFRAWLSTATVSAASRLSHHTGPYVLITGVKVADDWADLTDGTLDHAINRTPEGYDITGTQQARTGTTELGASHPTGDCNGWTSAATNLFVRVGRVAQSSSLWSTAVNDNCFTNSFIYCVEQ